MRIPGFVTLANLVVAVALADSTAPVAGAFCSIDCDSGDFVSATCAGSYCTCTADSGDSGWAQCSCAQGPSSSVDTCGPSCESNGNARHEDSECCSNICNDEYDECANYESPILINLEDASPNYHLTSIADGVVFDISADGRQERVAWTEADSKIAFLAADWNENGAIDDGSELFGTRTLKRDGTRARNGFEALLDLDGGLEASDGKVDQNDALYGRLRLWLDRNHNGSAETGELLTLPQAGVRAIYTSYRMSRRVDRHGNRYLYAGSALVLQNGREKLRNVFDVLLMVR